MDDNKKSPVLKMIPPSKRHVSMKTSRAVQTLRCLKQMHPDEVAKLDFVLVSEMSPVVKCYNHSMSIAADRQVDILYRDHALTLRKISRGQQAAYRNLMRVKNDMRRVHRERMLRHRQTEAFDYRSEQVARDRVEAEERMMRLTLGKTLERRDREGVDDDYVDEWTNDRGDEVATDAASSGWLRIRRRSPSAPNDQVRTIGNAEYSEKGLLRRQNFGKAESSNNIDVDTRREDTIGGTANRDRSSDDNYVSGSRQLKKKREAEIRLTFPTTKNAHLPTPNVSNQADSRTFDKGRQTVKSQPERAHGPKSPVRRIGRAMSSSFPPEDDTGSRDVKLTQMRLRLPEVIASWQERDTRGETDESTKWTPKAEPDVEIVAGLSPTRKTSERTPPSTTIKTVEIKQINKWGTTTRQLRLPELKMTPVEEVVRYRRDSDGQLVGRTTAVQSSTEKFQMPSKWPDYCRRRALQRQIEQYGSLGAKVDEFLIDCDSISPPAPSLGNGPSLLLFSRHNPLFAPANVSFSPLSLVTSDASTPSEKDS